MDWYGLERCNRGFDYDDDEIFGINSSRFDAMQGDMETSELICGRCATGWWGFYGLVVCGFLGSLVVAIFKELGARGR